MNRLAFLVIVILLALLVLESAFIVVIYPRNANQSTATSYTRTNSETVTAPYYRFNSPVTNNTDYSLKADHPGSWMVDIRSQLIASSPSDMESEAQIALAPEGPTEHALTPTIIVQERADGLLRIEYFAQNWPNSYGLLLYNSSSPGWLGNGNVTLKFVRFGPPASVNPQLAPRPNGNLTLIIGGTVYLDSYPVAWATLSSLYIYGLNGSAFRSGSLQLTFYDIKNTN